MTVSDEIHKQIIRHARYEKCRQTSTTEEKQNEKQKFIFSIQHRRALINHA